MPDLIPTALDVLLLSNSTNAGEHTLAHARDEIARVAAGRAVVFLPFALEDWDGYTALIQRALDGIEVLGAHQLPCVDESILEATCVFAGGGNTFRLLAALQRLDLVCSLRERILSGACSYIGSSAGTNIAGLSIRTTNDMPIVDTGSFTALQLVPFQINPHFTDATIENLSAETRSERIAQFHEHSSTPVVGLYEGAWLRVTSGRAFVEGPGLEPVAKVFQPGITHVLNDGDSVVPWWQHEPLDNMPSMLRFLNNRHHRSARSPMSI